MWIPLTPQHITESLSGLELTSLRTLQLAPDQADPIPEAIARTTTQVNGYVAAFHGTSVGQAGTIPEELLSSAIAIARWRIIGRLSVGPAAKLFATDNRRKEYEDAIAELKDVAAGKFAISVAEDPADDQPRPPADGAWGSAPKL
jgi:phage gp36-like protein